MTPDLQELLEKIFTQIEALVKTNGEIKTILASINHNEFNTQEILDDIRRNTN